MRGTRLLTDVYQRCNVVVCKPTSYDEAKQNKVWRAIMEEELFMIEKDQTRKLVDKPQDRKVIGVK